MAVVNFPAIGVRVDNIIKQFWQVIETLPDDTSASEIISALAITQFDMIERLKKKMTQPTQSEIYESIEYFRGQIDYASDLENTYVDCIDVKEIETLILAATNQPTYKAEDDPTDFDRMVYCEQYIGKDPQFDEWEKMHDPDAHLIRRLKCRLQTENTMHKAWRKRAEEAEANQPTCVTVDELMAAIVKTPGYTGTAMCTFSPRTVANWLIGLYPNGLKIIPNKQGD